MNLAATPVGLALVAGLLLSGCSSSTDVCSVVDGRPSSVELAFGAVRAEHPGERLSVKACVETTCQSADLSGDKVLVQGQVIQDAPLDVTLTLTDHAGHVVFDGRTTVHPVKEEVNGPGCPPTSWQARAAATADGVLRAVAVKPE